MFGVEITGIKKMMFIFDELLPKSQITPFADAFITRYINILSTFFDFKIVRADSETGGSISKCWISNKIEIWFFSKGGLIRIVK